MAFTIYDACVPPLAHMLGSFSSVLAKAEEHAKEAGVDPNSLSRAAAGARHAAADQAGAYRHRHGQGRRLASGGGGNPSYEDNETTIDQLKARLAKTIAYLKSWMPANSPAPRVAKST